MSSNTGGQVLNSGYTPSAGTNASAEMGDQVAILLSLKTPIRYRGGHGRIYLPAVGLNNINGDGRTLIPSVATSILAAYTTFQGAMAGIAGVNGGPFQQIVWHKHLSSAPNTTELVSAVVVSPMIATQRRRLRKVSRHKRKLSP
jgi:hypothetical protein